MGSDQSESARWKTTSANHLRRAIFNPYRKGYGARFTLNTWDTGRSNGSHNYLGYRLVMIEGTKRTEVFKGEDFGMPKGESIDSDRSIHEIMGFLCLRLGDTDREYFDRYTDVQCRFRDTYAEALGACVALRYEDENGRPKYR